LSPFSEGKEGRANEETKPIPADPKAKDEAARQVLRAGVEHTPERAQAAVKAVPDRTRSG